MHYWSFLFDDYWCFLIDAWWLFSPDANNIFTIFGYSAQKSDIDAVNLLKQNWNEKELEQFEIIVK